MLELTPETLRRLCDNRSSVGRLVGDAFEAHVRRSSSDSPSRVRHGFIRELSDLEWLAKMASIARKCERFEPLQFDEDEVDYSDAAARLELILAKQEAQQRAAAQRLACAAEKVPGQLAELAQAFGSDDCGLQGSLAARSTANPSRQSGAVDRKLDNDEQPPWRGPALPSPRHASVRLTPVHSGNLVICNLLTRCALGTIGQRGLSADERPIYTPDEPLCITRVSGFQPAELVVSYSGHELAVGELETWSALLKLASPANLGGRVSFWSRDVLELLHRGTGGPAYRRLREEIHRLQGAVVTMRTTLPSVKELFKEMFPTDPLVNDRRFTNTEHPIEVSFNLLGPASTDGSRWSIVVPREVALAFSPQLKTWFRKETYFSMKSDAARRLYLFYVSHVDPWPFTVRELSEFLGSGMSRAFDLRRQMTKAHDEMQRVGFIQSWSYGTSERRRIKEPVFNVSFAQRIEPPKTAV